ncbi:MAG: hypothetical protein NUW07_00855, partial [Candidatus Saccharicenans sp.]|nr:hypothetical protein [Candidatus Saccharicenans sp.]
MAGWFLLGLVLLLVLAGLLLQTAWGGKFILKKAGKIIEEKAGLNLQAERLKLNIFSLKATFAGLKLTASERSQLPLELMSCDRLVVQSGWSTLSGGELRIKNLEIIRPVVKLKAPAVTPGQPRVETVSSAAGSPKGFSFRLDKFRLEQGTFSYEQPTQPLSLALSEIKATVDFDQNSHFHRAAISGGYGSLVLGQGKSKIKELEIRAAFNQQTLKLARFSLASEDSLLGVSGTIDN